MTESDGEDDDSSAGYELLAVFETHQDQPAIDNACRFALNRKNALVSAWLSI